MDKREHPILQLSRIDKSFPGARALFQVDLTLRGGAIHALVGENGAGKSTLINILSGVFPPDQGEIRIDGDPVSFHRASDAHRRGIVTVYQDADLFPDLSVMENIAFQQDLPTFRGWLQWKLQRQAAEKTLAEMHLSLSPGQLAGNLSAAQRQMLSIAIGVSQQARILILDEPTSSLSTKEAMALFAHLRRLRDQGTAILYVSHRLEDIFALADEVTVLRDGERAWHGAISETSPDHLIRTMVGRAVELTTRQPVHQVGAPLLECKNLTASDGSFEGITLEVRAGEVLGLYGLIGAGRSEWAQSIFGLRGVKQGAILIRGKQTEAKHPAEMMAQGVAYIPEDRHRQGVCTGLSVRENALLASFAVQKDIRASFSKEKAKAEAIVSRFAIRSHSVAQLIRTLSGGNQQKVVLGRWLEVEPDVLILDEPTQGIDIGSKTEIHRLIHELAEQGKAIVLISSELPEVLSQSDRVGVFREGRLVETFEGRTATPEEVAAAAMPVQEVTADRRSNSRMAFPSFFKALQIREAALLLVLVVLLGGLELIRGNILTDAFFRNLLTDATLLGFCAIAATMVILVGGLDISLGALMALSAGIAGTLWESGLPGPMVFVIAIGVGGIGGCINGALSLWGRVHPIVITLGTMSLYRGLTLWLLRENVLLETTARGPFLSRLLGIEVLAWIGFAFLVLSWAFFRQTRTGREFYALGSNPSASHRAGISRASIWLMAFTIQGAVLGMAGLLYLIRSGDLQPTGHEDKTLTAIAAAVVGGVAITGGRGSVFGVFLGCLFLVSLGPICTILHISILWQRALVGVVMVIAVSMDALWRKGQ